VRAGKKQFAFNAASGWVAQSVFIGVGFLLMPYCISRLGSQGFGIYQLARSALVFFMFLQLGMGPTLVRFCSKAIARKDHEQIKRISSAAQFLLGGLGLLATLLCLAFIPVFLRFYEVPPELRREAAGLLVCMSLSLFLNMTFIVPQGLVYGSGRYDLANALDCIGCLLRLVLVVVLFEFIRPSVLFIGIAMLSESLLRWLTLFAIGRKLLGRSISFSIRYVRRETMVEILGFSMLNLTNSIAAAVVFQGPVLIIGKVLGQEMVTAFAPALLVASAMQGFLGQTMRPLVPLASRDLEENGGSALGLWAIWMGQLAAFIGFAIVLPLAIFGPEVVTLWLGDKLTWIWPVVAVMATGVAISQIQSGNYYLALGGGCIKPTVYSQIVLALVVFCGTALGTSLLQWRLIDVALFLGGGILIRNTFYMAYAYSKKFSYSYGRYLRLVYIAPSLIMLFCGVVGWGLKALWVPQNIAVLVFEGFAVLACYLILCGLFLMPRELVPVIRKRFMALIGRVSS
jgi:O-antigen/teichoic acid export membrane protein